MRRYYVYILAGHARRLYIGVTNDLQRRLVEHGLRRPGTFTGRYRFTRLVHVEETCCVRTAIAREKQLKRWPRARKVWLIERDNPDWRDLGATWGGPPR